ncbi:MAG: hypothetical protein JW768_14615 [Chitinispirillaceae bacterium]|nr:hypothetical protein [Chitinispirillaceae bacterium]
MYRVLLPCSIIAALCGCIDPEQPGTKPIVAASCNECHAFPGSDFCRTTTVPIQGKESTTCASCHWGAVMADSTPADTSGAGEQVYHDRMVQTHGGLYPVTQTLHANGAVDLNFRQCIKCHGHPPDHHIHNWHVQQLFFTCYECHVNSVKCSVAIIPDPMNPLDTIAQLGMYQVDIDGKIIPRSDETAHLNKRIDISFRKRKEDSLNHGALFDKSYYIYDRFQKKCSNMKGCMSTDRYLNEYSAEKGTR